MQPNYQCQVCGKSYVVKAAKPDGRYLCPQCKRPLVPTAEMPKTSTAMATAKTPPKPAASAIAGRPGRRQRRDRKGGSAWIAWVAALLIAAVGGHSLFRRKPPRYQAVEVAASSKAITVDGMRYDEISMVKYVPCFDTSQAELQESRSSADYSSPEAAEIARVSAVAVGDREWLLDTFSKTTKSAIQGNPDLAKAINDPSIWEKDRGRMHSRFYYKFVFRKNNTCYAAMVGTKVIDGEECNLGLFAFELENARWVQTQSLLGDPFMASLYKPLGAAVGEKGDFRKGLQAFETLAEELRARYAQEAHP